jgi:hypothetical protein
MEELQKTQEYPKERAQEERRRAQQPYEGDDRRGQEPKIEEPGEEPHKRMPPVSPLDGTGSR